MKCHELKVRVRYSETDQMGVVHHSNYFNYFEMGRIEYLRSLGLVYSELEKEQTYLVVTEVYCKYRASARYDDVLIVRTWVAELKPTRIEFRYEIVKDGDEARQIAEGFSVLACLDKTRKPVVLPGELKDLLATEVSRI
ncbi:MAG TPA: acyl-CoA thioesterase [Candidatus Brocadiia bacterium]|nr:acyl-CoA thioesterase [Planctomycetota bacterium]MBI4006871.1 acyl-CoA thioesterase [Planctomycetota bacterium]MDO8094199.1 thioesterase family protein [Candidatus Brocadiales bacterium]